VRYCTSFGGGRREDAKKVSGTSKPDFKIAAMGELKDEDEVQSSQVRDYATTTGGAIFHASKSNTMPDLYSRIMEQARHDYTIAYAPTGNIKNANFHTVKSHRHVPADGEYPERLLHKRFGDSPSVESRALNVAAFAFQGSLLCWRPYLRALLNSTPIRRLFLIGSLKPFVADPGTRDAREKEAT
jgi:hypothetical protein